jgi:hypothetical protein
VREEHGWLVRIGLGDGSAASIHVSDEIIAAA